MRKLRKNLLLYLSISLLLCSCGDTDSKKARIELIEENETVLKFTVVNLLNSTWTWNEAQNYIDQKGLKLTLQEVNKDKKIVSFMIDGILDNCSGIAYSENGQEAHLCGGKTVDWVRLFDNWYFVNSI